MDLAQGNKAGAVPLGGVIITLRRLYSPLFETDAALAAALGAIDSREKALARTVALERARHPSAALAS